MKSQRNKTNEQIYKKSKFRPVMQTSYGVNWGVGILSVLLV